MHIEERRDYGLFLNAKRHILRSKNVDYRELQYNYY